ncbi:MAG: outer membrane lipoprotein carrier protein LolA [Elusimicrobia bacterium]|nr:outer membrane lipoprotein carrier protein LolA [Elusimicrobiota bacterium]
MVKLILSILIGTMLLSTAITAAEKKNPTNEKQKIEAPAAAKELPFAERVLKELEDWDIKLKSLKTEFIQEVNFSEAGLRENIQGIIHFLKPNHLRIEHIKPSRQIVFTDKTFLWIYKPEDLQAVKTSWEGWRNSQNQNFSGILEFGNYKSIIEKNNVSVRKKADLDLINAVFTSKKDPELYVLTLGLSATDYFPMEASLKIDKTIIKTKLANVERNIEISTGIFKFVPPKGTEILEIN